MTNVERFLRFLERERPKVLDKRARALAKEIARSRVKSRRFLQSIGVLDKNGKLIGPYRHMPAP